MRKRYRGSLAAALLLVGTTASLAGDSDPQRDTITLLNDIVVWQLSPWESVLLEL